VRKQLTWRYKDENKVPILKDSFNNLLNYCFKEATLVTLSDMQFARKRASHFMTQLKGCHIATIQTRRWFHMDFTTADYTSEPLQGFTIVYLYQASKNVKRIIKKHTDNLFLLTNTINGMYEISPHMLEDLCFFRENKLLLGTSSHNYHCTIYPESDDEVYIFKEILSAEESIASFEVNDVDCTLDINLADFVMGGH